MKLNFGFIKDKTFLKNLDQFINWKAERIAMNLDMLKKLINVYDTTFARFNQLKLKEYEEKRYPDCVLNKQKEILEYLRALSDK